MGTSSTKEHKTFYVDGTLQSRYFVKDNHLHGESTSYFENGLPRRISNYDTGRLTGCLLEYYPNGKIYTESHYKNDELDNNYKHYDKNGLLKSHNIYRNGVPTILAGYNNNRLCVYMVNSYNYHQYVNRQYVICINSHKCFKYINWSIINPICAIQRRFRYRFYTPISDVLNYIIGINDVSKIILSYVTNSTIWIKN
jgi:antitoxin component YwqK of YwqJK toxin-antitoxin module